MDRADPEASCTELDGKQQQQQQQLRQDEVEFISEQNSVDDKMLSTSSEYVLTGDTDDLTKSKLNVGTHLGIPRRATKASVKSPPATASDLDGEDDDGNDDGGRDNIEVVDDGDDDDDNNSDDDDAENDILSIENVSKSNNDRNEQRRLVKENGGASIKSKKRLLSNDNNTDHINGSENEEEEDFAGFGEADINENRGVLAKKFKSEHVNDIDSAQKSPYRSPRRAAAATTTTTTTAAAVVHPAKKETESTEAKISLDDVSADVSVAKDSRRSVPTRRPTPSTPMNPIAITAAAESKEKGHVITRDPRYRNPFKYGWRRELVFRANFDGKQKIENKGEVYYHTPSGKKLRTKADIVAYLRKDQDLDIGDFTFAKESIGMPPDQEIVRNAKIQTPAQRHRPSLPMDTPSPDLVLGKRVPKPKMPKGASPPPPSLAAKSKLSNAKRAAAPETEIIQTKSTKSTSKGETCTIQCVLAMGTIPQLQCKKCLCLYHQECVGLDRYDGPRGTYICERCIAELAAADAQQPKSTTTDLATGTMSVAGGNNQLLGSDTTVTATVTTSTKQRDRSSRKSSTTGPTSALHNGSRASSTSSMTAASKRNSKDESNSLYGSGSTTRGLPSQSTTTNMTQSQSQSMDANVTSPPQSVAIVAGRKYIMVPKMASMSVTANIVANGSNDSSRSITPVATKPLTTGEDSTPQTKKRRSNSGAVAINTSAAALISTSSSASVHTLFAADFFNNISKGYSILLQTFQYLKVQELLRASRVCRLWNSAANNSILWKTVRMKNSQVNDWAGLICTLRRHATQHLDLRKVILSPSLSWSEFLEHIGDAIELQSIDLCKCPAEVVVGLFEANPNLRILNAVSIMGSTITLPAPNKLIQLTELRLKAVSASIAIENLSALKKLTKLRHLSLTAMEGIDVSNFDTIGTLTALESLELGDCTEFTAPFARSVLIKLKQLQRLRLEKGQEKCCTFEILDAITRLPKLSQLELINFDIKAGFDARIGLCKNLRRLLLIPTYISQSATTNNMILSGILKLEDTLQEFTWVVTQELLRVTELYVDQCYTNDQDRRPMEDKIPILKPVPMMSKDAQKSANENAVSEAPQVEILPLHMVENMIVEAIPQMKLQIRKVPFPATWRQTLTGHQ